MRVSLTRCLSLSLSLDSLTVSLQSFAGECEHASTLCCPRHHPLLEEQPCWPEEANRSSEDVGGAYGRSAGRVPAGRQAKSKLEEQRELEAAKRAKSQQEAAALLKTSPPVSRRRPRAVGVNTCPVERTTHNSGSSGSNLSGRGSSRKQARREIDSFLTELQAHSKQRRATEQTSAASSSTNVFVSNIAPDVTEETLHSVFSRWGEVASVKSCGLASHSMDKFVAPITGL